MKPDSRKLARNPAADDENKKGGVGHPYYRWRRPRADAISDDETTQATVSGAANGRNSKADSS